MIRKTNKLSCANKKKSICYLRSIPVLLSFILSGCSSSRIVSVSKLKLTNDFCVSPVGYPVDKHVVQVINYDSMIDRNPLLNCCFSKQDLMMANATATLNLLPALIGFAGDSSLRGRLSYLEQNAQIQQKISLMRITIDAFSAEIECEITRTKEIAAYLSNLGKRGNRRLTAGAITSGAVTTLAPVWISNKNIQNTIVVSAGLISVALAILTLHPGGKKVNLIHERNLFSDIWFQHTNSTIYPAGLWYILNERRLSNTPNVSKTEIVKMRWIKFYFNGKSDTNTEQLLFEHGGVYGVDNLELRASMLHELKSAVTSINQNLEHFVAGLNSVK